MSDGRLQQTSRIRLADPCGTVLSSAAAGAYTPFRLIGVKETAPKELWGGETRKAVENFQVSGEPIPVSVARWLGRIKAAAA
jgi:hypothetical protein